MTININHPSIPPGTSSAEAADELCHCGRPLHYSNPDTERIARELVAQFGSTILVTMNGRSWRVPRHFIFLHGLHGQDLPTLGFEEVTGAREGA